jgi:GTPase SAR1 family protein
MEQIGNHSCHQLYSRYKGLSVAYYRGADGIFIVYDITDRSSYAQVPSYIESIQQHSKPGVALLIIGNKSDLEAQRVVSFEEGKALADELNASFMETSARTSANIEAAFCSMAATIKARLEARALNYDGLRVSSKELAAATACY